MNVVKKRIISSFVVTVMLFSALILVCFVFLNRSVAWFASNSNVEANGMAVSVEAMDGISLTALRVIKYDVDNQEMIVSQTDDPTSPDNLQLNSFDTVFEERQEYTSMILIATLTNTDGSPFSVNINCIGSLLDDSKLAGNISNIMEIKCALSSYLDSYNPDLDPNNSDLYHQAKNFFENDANEANGDIIVENKFKNEQFVSVTNGVLGDKTDAIKFHVGERGEAGHDEVLTLYFYINYDSALIEKYIMDRFGTNSVGTEFLSSEDNKIDFTSDIDMVVFEKENP